MQALIFRETGEPQSVLQLAEIPTPPLASGEALVRVLLSPINPSDLHMVRGRYGYQPELPASPALKAWGLWRLWVRACTVQLWELASFSCTPGTPGASRSCAQWTDSCPCQMAWTIQPPPPPTRIL